MKLFNCGWNLWHTHRVWRMEATFQSHLLDTTINQTTLWFYLCYIYLLLQFLFYLGQSDNWPSQVSCVVGTCDTWLCVARLHVSMTEAEFHNLVSSYGRVGQCFLVCSETTGVSKGYGVVRYLCSQAAAQARHLLDGKLINGVKIQVCSTKSVSCWGNITMLLFCNVVVKTPWLFYVKFVVNFFMRSFFFTTNGITN